jgi:CheY-like chemotaxis protein
MARKRVLIVSSSSVARALLSSLLDANDWETVVADSLPAALKLVAASAPHAAVVHADLVRASPDALERLRAACRDASKSPEGGTRLPVVLADRGYSDERRAATEVATFGAGAAVPVPTDARALTEAITAATSGRPRQPSQPIVTNADVPDARAVDAEQAARYAERLAARIETMDAYQVLRVARTATQADIDTAFRQRALEYHPDRQQHVPDDATREHLYRIFKRVSWAVRQIGDTASRKAYDQSLEARRPV